MSTRRIRWDLVQIRPAERLACLSADAVLAFPFRPIDEGERETMATTDPRSRVFRIIFLDSSVSAPTHSGRLGGLP